MNAGCIKKKVTTTLVNVGDNRVKKYDVKERSRKSDQVKNLVVIVQVKVLKWQRQMRYFSQESWFAFSCWRTASEGFVLFNSDFASTVPRNESSFPKRPSTCKSLFTAKTFNHLPLPTQTHHALELRQHVWRHPKRSHVQCRSTHPRVRLA